MTITISYKHFNRTCLSQSKTYLNSFFFFNMLHFMMNVTVVREFSICDTSLIMDEKAVLHLQTTNQTCSTIVVVPSRTLQVTITSFQVKRFSNNFRIHIFRCDNVLYVKRRTETLTNSCMISQEVRRYDTMVFGNTLSVVNKLARSPTITLDYYGKS